MEKLKTLWLRDKKTSKNLDFKKFRKPESTDWFLYEENTLLLNEVTCRHQRAVTNKVLIKITNLQTTLTFPELNRDECTTQSNINDGAF